MGMNFTALFDMARFASEGSGFHIVLKAEELLVIGPFVITNSTLLGFVVAGFMIWVMTKAAKLIAVKPGNLFSQVIEAGCEFVINTAEGIFHSRKKAVTYAPMLLTLFFFILLNNWAGLLPGVGTILGRSHGEAAPLFRPFTSDINGTLALAIVTIVLVQIYAIRELGVKGHLKHYFSNQPWNPINLFVGFLEVIGEFTRIMSLSLRLFGNVFAGEVLIAVISKISSFGSPLTTLPFIFMEMFVGFIQAFVFTMLTIVFLAVATHHEESEEHSSDHGEAPALAETATS